MNKKSLGMTLAIAAGALFTTTPVTSVLAAEVTNFSVEQPGSKTNCRSFGNCPTQTAPAQPTNANQKKMPKRSVKPQPKQDGSFTY